MMRSFLCVVKTGNLCLSVGRFTRLSCNELLFLVCLVGGFSSHLQGLGGSWWRCCRTPQTLSPHHYW